MFMMNVLEVDTIECSPAVKGSIVLAMRSATKNDALGVDTLAEMVVFNSCSLFLSSFIFLLKSSTGGWSPGDKAVLKAVWLHERACCHILFLDRLGQCELPAAMNP